MCIFHKWGKWTQYESTAIKCFYNFPCLITRLHQVRTCQHCGFSQDEWLSSKDVVKLKSTEIIDCCEGGSHWGHAYGCKKVIDY